MNGASNVLAYRPDEWDDVVRLGRNLPGFVFRGHNDARWRLTTTLERTAARYQLSPPDVPSREKRIVAAFKRSAHLYFPAQLLPDERDWLGWLSLLQHYGAPTRLLDFSESYYCGIYFAVEGAKGDAAVWGIAHGQLQARACSTLELDVDAREFDSGVLALQHSLREYLERNWKDDCGRQAVFPFYPERLHERLAHQQGLFAVPVRSDVPFEEQLFKTLLVSEDDVTRARARPLAVEKEVDLDLLGQTRLVIIELPIGLHRVGRDQLRRMNVTASSLFPGPEGFARSLDWYLGDQQPGEAVFTPKDLITY